MSFVHRINAWLLRRLRPKSAIRIDPEPAALCLREGDQEARISWDEISRITVLSRDVYVPSDFRIMLVEWGDQHVLELNEDMLGWDKLPEVIDHCLPGAMAGHLWLLEIQTAPQRPLIIYTRAKKE